MDEQDSSVTRPLELYRKLFAEAELDCYRQMKQHNFPKVIYSVYMFALKPLTKVCSVLSEDESGKSDSNICTESEIHVNYSSGQANVNLNLCNEHNGT